MPLSPDGKLFYMQAVYTFFNSPCYMSSVAVKGSQPYHNM